MPKMVFTNDNTNKIFANTTCGFDGYYDLMDDLANGRACYNKEGKEVSKEKANAELRKVMYNVLGVEEGTKGTKLLQAMRRHKIDVYEVTETTLENMIKTGWGANPFFNEYVEIKNADDDEINEFYTDTPCTLTVSELSGGHHNLFRQRLPEGQGFSVKTSWYGVKIYTEYFRFLTGKVDWAGFINKVYEAFDKKVNSMVYATLGTAGDALPTGGQWVKNIPLTQETKPILIELIQDVQTANESDVVIMGTKVALSKLADLEKVEWIAEQAKFDRYTTGRVGYFEGVKLAEIPQVFADNDTTTKLVSNDKLLIMPAVSDNKFIKIYNEGLAQIRDTEDKNTNTDMTLDFEYQRKMGVGIIIGRVFGIVNITANISG